MRQSTPLLARSLATALVLASAMIGGPAHAAGGNNGGSPAPHPNPRVLLLVDNSGSMGYTSGGHKPTCTPGVTPVTVPEVTLADIIANDKAKGDRWSQLLQALVGSINNASCVSVARDTNNFGAEYKINGHLPYDLNYQLAYSGGTPAQNAQSYNRILSGTCALTPACLPTGSGGTPSGGVGAADTRCSSGGDLRDFDATAIRAVPLKTPVASGIIDPSGSGDTCSFPTPTDGVIDKFSGHIQFGFMSFDNDPDNNNNLNPTGPQFPQCGLFPNNCSQCNQRFAQLSQAFSPDTTNPFSGQWTYLSQYNSGTSADGVAHNGVWAKLAGCNDILWEVGARNSAAPPWELPYIPFTIWNEAGHPDVNVNAPANIKRALLAGRPYGATPIAGLLRDAADALLVQPAISSSRNYDPSVAGGCVQQFAILVTDGNPNQDLRDPCEGTTTTTTTTTTTGTASTTTTSTTTISNPGICPFNAESNYAANRPHSPGPAAGVVYDMLNANVSAFNGPTTVPYGVRTFVVGFAATGSDASKLDQAVTDSQPTEAGFPDGGAQHAYDNTWGHTQMELQRNLNCSWWYKNSTDDPSVTTKIPNPIDWLQNVCEYHGADGISSRPPAAFYPIPGSTGEACCNLHNIAVAGSPTGLTPPAHAYFAENRSDLTAIFVEILKTIAQSETTNTTPAFGTALNGGDFATSVQARYSASYTPSLVDLPAGDIVRQRSVCSASGGSSDAPLSGGDDYAQNASYSLQHNGNGRAVMVIGFDNGGQGSKESLATLRPMLVPQNVSPDGLDATVHSTMSIVETGNGFPDTSISTAQGDELISPESLGITAANVSTLCGAVTGPIFPNPANSGANKPARNATECLKDAWNFADSDPYDYVAGTPGYHMNNRCYSTYCTGLGPIIDTPTYVGPPNTTIRDPGYQQFALDIAAAGRKSLLIATSTDGLIHFFDATNGDPAFQFATSTGTPQRNELFTIIPPGAFTLLPGSRNANNVGDWYSGHVISRDVPFARSFADLGIGKKWHTVMIASENGTNGKGFMAMDITSTAPFATDGSGTTTAQPANGTTELSGDQVGAQFLWEIKTARSTGTASDKSPNGDHPLANSTGVVDSKRLFGSTKTGAPVIFTHYGIDNVEDAYVLIPGGGELLQTAAPADQGVTITPPIQDGLDDFKWSTKVRKWGASVTNTTEPLPGAAACVMRVRDGVIVRCFARWYTYNGVTTWNDVPEAVRNVPNIMGATGFDQAPFESPLTVEPVCPENRPTENAPYCYMGDDDGRIYRANFTDKNPQNWFIELVADIAGSDIYFPDDSSAPANTNSSATTFTDGYASQTVANTALPVRRAVVRMSLALDDLGRNVLIAATGPHDDSYAFPPNHSYDRVFSFTERYVDVGSAYKSTSSARKLRLKINWFHNLADYERITGPMTIFGSYVYFTTFTTSSSTGQCGAGGAKLYSRHFTIPQDFIPAHPGLPARNTGNGGLVNVGFGDPSVDPPSAALDLGPDPATGVSIQATLACVDVNAQRFTDPALGTTSIPSFGDSRSSFNVVVPIAGKGPSGKLAPPRVMPTPPLPTSSTLRVAWKKCANY